MIISFIDGRVIAFEIMYLKVILSLNQLINVLYILPESEYQLPACMAFLTGIFKAFLNYLRPN